LACHEQAQRVEWRCSVIFEGSEQMGDTIKYRINWIQVDGDWQIYSVITLASHKTAACSPF